MPANFSTLTPDASASQVDNSPKNALKNDWFERIPKAELHIHIEGSIPPTALWELIQKYGGDPEVRTLEDLERKFQYKDFAHFIQTWIWKNGFLREYEDFEFIAEAVARELLKQNILYVEGFYSPPNHTHDKRIETGRLTEAFRRGLDRVPEIEVKLIADLVRDFGPKEALRTLEDLNEVKNFEVIGIGIGGTEYEYPASLFTEAYERARAFGFHTTAHAGEVAGPESVWSAINDLRVERIGHGTRAALDPALIDYLRETKLPIEMCPISNVRTGSVTSLEEHPIRKFFDQDLMVFVNTDDPAMFNTSMAEEFRALTRTHSFTQDEIRKLILNAIRASWLSGERKTALAQKFTTHPDW